MVLMLRTNGAEYQLNPNQALGNNMFSLTVSWFTNF